MMTTEYRVLTFVIAALFRAARIASGVEQKPNEYPNNDAIRDAKEFINACKQHDAWPRDWQ